LENNAPAALNITLLRNLSRLDRFRVNLVNAGWKFGLLKNNSKLSNTVSVIGPTTCRLSKTMLMPFIFSCHTTRKLGFFIILLAHKNIFPRLLETLGLVVKSMIPSNRSTSPLWAFGSTQMLRIFCRRLLSKSTPTGLVSTEAKFSCNLYLMSQVSSSPDEFTA